MVIVASVISFSFTVSLLSLPLIHTPDPGRRCHSLAVDLRLSRSDLRTGRRLSIASALLRFHVLDLEHDCLIDGLVVAVFDQLSRDYLSLLAQSSTGRCEFALSPPQPPFPLVLPHFHSLCFSFLS